MLSALIAALIGIGTALLFVQIVWVKVVGGIMLVLGIGIVVVFFVADRLFFLHNE